MATGDDTPRDKLKKICQESNFDLFSLNEDERKQFLSDKRILFVQKIYMNDLKEWLTKEPNAVITCRQKKDVMSENIKDDQIGTLLEILEKRSKESFEGFFEALIASGQEHVVTASLEGISNGGKKSEYDNLSVEPLSQEQVHVLGKYLKRKYRHKYSEVNFVQADENPQNFDVDSDLYKPVQYMPIEISCTRYSQQNVKTKMTKVGQKRKKQCTTEETNERSDTNENVPEDDHLLNTESTKEITKLLTEEYNRKTFPILVEAEAGVGKTTLLHRLAVDWANGDCKVLKTFDLVFLIHLRLVKNTRIEDIICEDLDLLPTEDKMKLRKYLKLCNDKVLYLIDGLDEVKMSNENEIVQIMREPGNHVICTSRPVLQPKDKGSPHGMKKRLHVKLLGFSDYTIHSYIKTYFHMDDDEGQNKADRILDECRKHMFCKAIMRTPLYTGLICFLWEKHNYNLPDTATQLFNTFLKEKLIIFWSKRGGSESVDVDFERNPLEKKVHIKIRNCLFHVAELAFKTLSAGKVVFSSRDVDDCYLSMDDIIQLGIFTIEDPFGSVVQFSHKLFHEYFAGLWLVRSHLILENFFQLNMREILHRKHNLHHAFFFASGMCTKGFNVMMSALRLEIEGILGKKGCCNKEHPFSRGNEMKSPTNTDPLEKCYVDIFKLQLIFEQGREGGGVHTSLDTIPVHFASAHSIAAAFTLMATVNPDCKHLTLIDGGHTDTEQIRSIFNECQRSEHFNSIKIYDGTIKVMRELHMMDKSQVSEIDFHHCEVVANVKSLCNIFPKLKVIIYDGMHSSVHGRYTSISQNFTNGIAIVLEGVGQELNVNHPSFTGKVFVRIDKYQSLADPLGGCKVRHVETNNIQALLTLNATERQWVNVIIILTTSDHGLYFKELCRQFPNIQLIVTEQHEIEVFFKDQIEILPNAKPVRLLISKKSHLHSKSEITSQTVKLNTITVVFVNINDFPEKMPPYTFYANMPISSVSTFGMGSKFLCEPGQCQKSQQAPHQHPSSQSLQKPPFNKRRITGIVQPLSPMVTPFDDDCLHKRSMHDFLNYYFGVPQIILGPMLATPELCDYIILQLNTTLMNRYTWTLEGQFIKELPNPAKMSLDDWFCTDIQWLEWGQFKYKYLEIYLKYKKVTNQGVRMDTPMGVIRFTRREK